MTVSRQDLLLDLIRALDEYAEARVLNEQHSSAREWAAWEKVMAIRREIDYG